ncbi:hypothetical protein BTVI_134537 [Pitangus sulphuratus]|nr:hypothetical protein BTVI_134537 [Pitangus sulphuratus]
MEVHGGADSHLQPREDLMLEQRDVPKGKFDLGKSLHWSRFLAEPVARRRGAHAGAVHEELQPVGRTNTGEVHEQLWMNFLFHNHLGLPLDSLTLSEMTENEFPRMSDNSFSTLTSTDKIKVITDKDYAMGLLCHPDY